MASFKMRPYLPQTNAKAVQIRRGYRRPIIHQFRRQIAPRLRREMFHATRLEIYQGAESRELGLAGIIQVYQYILRGNAKVKQALLMGIMQALADSSHRIEELPWKV